MGGNHYLITRFLYFNFVYVFVCKFLKLRRKTNFQFECFRFRKFSEWEISHRIAEEKYHNSKIFPLKLTSTYIKKRNKVKLDFFKKDFH